MRPCRPTLRRGAGTTTGVQGVELSRGVEKLDLEVEIDDGQVRAALCADDD
jgi:hypothetical protein